MGEIIEAEEIAWGETYRREIEVRDETNEIIPMDATWSAACLFTRDFLKGEEVVSLVIDVSGGTGWIEVDTRDPEWRPGVYVYDVRVTDPDGNDNWSGENRLILKRRNTNNT